MIRFEGVTKNYGPGNDALSEVDLHIERGEMAFLTGHSGAGKSTLLRLIMLLERPSRGRVRVAGQKLEDLSNRRIPYFRRHIGVVFQDHHLLFDRNVFENVALPLDIEGVDPNEKARRVRAALDKVGLLKKERLHPQALSGGEQQRVGIARAVVNRPPILLADEPTGNLDPVLSSEIMGLFHQFNQVGATVLVASHDLGLISGYSHRILELDHGRLARG